MTQIENSISQSVKLKQEETVHIESLVDLLVELNIIESPEPSLETDDQDKYATENIEFLELAPVPWEICEAYLESTLLSRHNLPITSQIVREEIEEPLQMIAIFEESLDNLNSDIVEDPLKKLQQILLGKELDYFNSILTELTQKFTKLEYQIYTPQELINLMLPCISELLKLKITESKEEIAQIISPIIDQAIQSRTTQDKISVSMAIAPAVPLAISQQIIVAPQEVSEAIAPAMGQAIKKQIELEQNIMVDALYPIIGSTISKYMAETISAINRQLEETLSVDGIKRKIRARLQRVSEAELILKEALPFAIQAIFLIHKASGLVISDIQNADTQQLEAEMVAGMLTAIRSFANDCINQSGSVSELDTIAYGTSKIILEVAGYCYLAIVVQGEPNKKFIWEMRQSFSKIVKTYGDVIEKFDGNPDSVPIEIHTLLEAIKNADVQQKKQKSKFSPLLLLSLTVISSIIIPWSIWQRHTAIINSIESKNALAIASIPELAIYRLTVEVKHNKLKLTGRLPNQVLRQKAEQIVKITSPNWLIDNQILLVEVPADPVLAAAEVKRVTTVLNQTDGTAISTQYIDGKVAIVGTVNRIADIHTIVQAFEQIPGVKSVYSEVRVEPVEIKVRFYFEPDSGNLLKADLRSKIQQVKFFLNQHPSKNLKIIGYSNERNDKISSHHLGLMRAKAVQQALIKLGVNPSRLQLMSRTNLPPGIDATHPLWLSRCVVLEPFSQ
ncbi:OmpA family protein [Nostoc sp. TCL26-01]|uniref:OmpA family protein n=1 Tax=Nostoc sp. TCL26-01 TaxID=2576904 RepID=UPI0015BE597E|nr:BON domain-containing protein [Nostoc sp. TCL26-01]QLE54095.1 BON domain-containing protein [Nostoc sp. TCL26-01]